LRYFIKTSVRYGCTLGGLETPEGKAAAHRMQPLYYGFWFLMHSNKLASKIVAANIDMNRWRRWKQSKQELPPDRQIWYYTRWHLSNVLSHQLRYQLYEDPPKLIDGSVDEAGKTDLRKQIRRTARAASMMYGRLVAISLGHKCLAVHDEGTERGLT